jgi:hypothetical protein
MARRAANWRPVVSLAPGSCPCHSCHRQRWTDKWCRPCDCVHRRSAVELTRSSTGTHVCAHARSHFSATPRVIASRIKQHINGGRRTGARFSLCCRACRCACVGTSRCAQSATFSSTATKNPPVSWWCGRKRIVRLRGNVSAMSGGNMVGSSLSPWLKTEGSASSHDENHFLDLGAWTCKSRGRVRGRFRGSWLREGEQRAQDDRELGVGVLRSLPPTWRTSERIQAAQCHRHPRPLTAREDTQMGEL